VIGGGDFAFALSGNHMVGPKVDLTIEESSIHGVLGSQLLRLTVEGDKVFGPAPLGDVSLSTQPDGPGRIVRGLYGPYKLQVRIGPDKIDGTVVRNWFLQRAADGVYRGSGAELKAPQTIVDRLGDVRLAAVLVLALANLAMEGQYAPGAPPPQVFPGSAGRTR